MKYDYNMQIKFNDILILYLFIYLPKLLRYILYLILHNNNSIVIFYDFHNKYIFLSIFFWKFFFIFMNNCKYLY
jgi:hypothetical protein